MSEEIALDEIPLKEGHLQGPWRRPRNMSLGSEGSLHHDATAQQLGFRGGAVAGRIHLEIYPPLLLKALGPRWFQRGTVSIDFKSPTLDQEEVRGLVGVPPEGATDPQVPAWIECPTGEIVGEGTASVRNSKEPTALITKDIHKYDVGEYVILKEVLPGDGSPLSK